MRTREIGVSLWLTAALLAGCSWGDLGPVYQALHPHRWRECPVPPPSYRSPAIVHRETGRVWVWWDERLHEVDTGTLEHHEVARIPGLRALWRRGEGWLAVCRLREGVLEVREFVKPDRQTVLGRILLSGDDLTLLESGIGVRSKDELALFRLDTRATVSLPPPPEGSTFCWDPYRSKAWAWFSKPFEIYEVNSGETGWTAVALDPELRAFAERPARGKQLLPIPRGLVLYDSTCDLSLASIGPVGLSQERAVQVPRHGLVSVREAGQRDIVFARMMAMVYWVDLGNGGARAAELARYDHSGQILEALSPDRYLSIDLEGVRILDSSGAVIAFRPGGL